MDISIVISAYTLDRLNDLEDCLKSISSQKFPGLEILIIAENDAKLISTFEKTFADFDVRILACKKRGLSSARNLGVEESSGNIVVFLDDDAVPSNDWLKTLIKPFDDPEVLAVGGGIIPDWIGSRPSWFPRELNWTVGCIYSGHTVKDGPVRNIIGANMSFRREMFTSVGIFNPNIGAGSPTKMAGEESEFCMRLRQIHGAGHIMFIPGAMVKHRVPPGRQRLEYVFRRAYTEGVSKAVIQKLFVNKFQNQDTQLDTEWEHIWYLATKGIPGKLWPGSEDGGIGKFIALASCTLLVLLGYVRGHFVKVKGVI